LGRNKASQSSPGWRYAYPNERKIQLRL